MYGKFEGFLAEHLAHNHKIQRQDDESHKVRQETRRISLDEHQALTGPSVAPKKNTIVGIAIINGFVG